MPAVCVIFTGPAGSGKTSLVRAYSEWIEKNLFLRVGAVNLDPGAEIISYKPVFDIRWIFTLKDVMEEYNLGPNGAFIKASELLADRADEILSRPPFSELNEWDIILIDTPGQMEAFLFRPASSVLFRRLSRMTNTIIVYIIDGSALLRLSDAIFLWFLYVLVQLKTGILTIPVINKRDVTPNQKLAKILVEDPARLIEEAKDEGLAQEMIPDLVNVAMKTKGPFRAILVSAKELSDMEYLHTAIHEAFCACGDLT